jgi:hypothetical protein
MLWALIRPEVLRKGRGAGPVTNLCREAGDFVSRFPNSNQGMVLHGLGALFQIVDEKTLLDRLGQQIAVDLAMRVRKTLFL